MPFLPRQLPALSGTPQEFLARLAPPPPKEPPREAQPRLPRRMASEKIDPRTYEPDFEATVAVLFGGNPSVDRLTGELVLDERPGARPGERP